MLLCTMADQVWKWLPNWPVNGKYMNGSSHIYTLINDEKGCGFYTHVLFVLLFHYQMQIVLTPDYLQYLAEIFLSSCIIYTPAKQLCTFHDMKIRWNMVHFFWTVQKVKSHKIILSIWPITIAMNINPHHLHVHVVT